MSRTLQVTMGNIRRNILVLCASLAVLLVAVWGLAPVGVRWYANRQQGVHVEAVRLHWRCLQFEQVRLQRGRVSGYAPTVWYCAGKQVRIAGGSFEVEASKRSSSGTPEGDGYRIEAEGLDVTVKDPAPFSQAHLQGVSLHEGVVRFQSATLEHPAIKPAVQVEGGVVEKDHNTVSFATVQLVGDEQGVPVQGYWVTGMVHGGTLALKEQRVVVQRAHLKAVKEGCTQPCTDTVEADLKAVTAQLQGTQLTLLVANADVTHRGLTEAGPLTFKNLETAVDVKHPLQGVRTVRVGRVAIQLDPADLWVKGAAPCSDWLDAFPEQLREGTPLAQLQLEGTLSFEVKTKPAVALHVEHRCKAVCNDTLNALRGTFTYKAYHPDKTTWSRTTGPGSADWVPLAGVSENMTLALLTTEDPGFFHHRGYIVEALRNSLADNLRAGHVVRGGSTLTMQLAKNLWLPRSRTYTRKAQEVFLTTALESCLTKEQILELYLNVVEFGPDIYGIGPASAKLLSTDPARLSLVEALYLTTRLPRPLRAGPFDRTKLEGAARLMDIMIKSGRLTEEQKAVELGAAGLPPDGDDPGGEAGWGL